ncbi:N-methyltransferase [Hordeum vulgare]|nr:N-methyltransferase [Hordeum vulgare]
MDKITAPFFSISGGSPDAATVAGADDEDDKLCFQAQELMFAYNVSMVLRAAIQLGLLDAIIAAGGNALTPYELAGKMDTGNGIKDEVAASVDRILRYLSCFNVVTCSSEAAAGPDDGALVRRYTAGPLCRWLAKHNFDGTLSPFAIFMVDPDHLFPWHHIAEAVTAGGPPAFERTQGCPYYEYMGKNRRLGTLFDNAMERHSVILVTKMLERFRGFEGVQRLVDVGGGNGSTLGMITSKYKHMTGINYDLPHVIAQGLILPGVEHVAGDMYDSIPTGDAVLLQWITLMVNDEECSKILKNCHKALPKNGKVIIVDGILPETPDSSLTARDAFTLDIIMFVLFKGAKQRTEKEFAKLAKQTGFTGVIKKTYIFFNFYALEFTK